MGAMRGKSTILLWASDLGWRKTLCWLLSEAGYDVACGTSESHAMMLATTDGIALAVVDIGQCDDDIGPGLVRQLHASCRNIKVIATSGAEAPNLAPDLTEGVFQHLRWPDDLDRLAVVAGEALGVCQGTDVSAHREHIGPLRRSSQAARGAGAVTHTLVGTTEHVRKAVHLIEQVAPSDMTVLIRGESGTGKDVVARLVHAKSARAASGSFVKINCPAIPETLLESELFGYEKGAFTGAVSQKPGRFELAGGGTIFLDEIGLMSPAMQSKLLDVIEQKQFVRVGGKGTTYVDARIIAATNSPLEDMIAKEAFRPDLFYRLRQFTIFLAPLRDRPEDIPLLCEHFLKLYTAKRGFTHNELPAGVMPQLMRYPWPGNIRELETVIARYALCGDTEALIQATTTEEQSADASGEGDKLEKVERTTILASLAECHWNRRRAASHLGISYSALRRRMSKYGIDTEPSSFAKCNAS
jgi:DNA-binding NtrC family response regulator